MARIWTMSQIEKVFETDGEKLNVKGGAAVAALLFLLWFAIVQTNQQKYFVPVVFAVLLVAQSDPGGDYREAGGGNVGLRSAWCPGDGLRLLRRR